MPMTGDIVAIVLSFCRGQWVEGVFGEVAVERLEEGEMRRRGTEERKQS